jgi:hypothetical protein
VPLTDRAVSTAKPSEKPRKIFDGRGLHLIISPKGGKWWRFKYRFEGKEKQVSLGVYPDVSLKDARERQEEARKLVAASIDPSQHRKAKKSSSAEKAENSFEVIAREWFARRSPSWVPSYGDRIIRRLERDIFPWMGSKPIANISAPQLLETVRRIEDPAHWKLRTVPSRIADKCSAPPSPLVVPNAVLA